MFALGVSVVLILNVVEHRKEKKRLEKHLNDIDHLADMIQPDYVVLVFDNAKEKFEFIESIGGERKFNTFHIKTKQKVDNVRLLSTEERRAGKS